MLKTTYSNFISLDVQPVAVSELRAKLKALDTYLTQFDDEERVRAGYSYKPPSMIVLSFVVTRVDEHATKELKK